MKYKIIIALCILTILLGCIDYNDNILAEPEWYQMEICDDQIVILDYGDSKNITTRRDICNSYISISIRRNDINDNIYTKRNRNSD